MKYNKQLADLIRTEYNKVFELSNFITGSLIEKTEEFSSYESQINLELYVQAVLVQMVLDDEPKNPALFNMLKKLVKFSNFYQGIDLDLWFNNKEKVLDLLSRKAKTYINEIPTVINITVKIDQTSKKTELSYQLLEAILGLTLTLYQGTTSFEEVEEKVLNKYLSAIYNYINQEL